MLSSWTSSKGQFGSAVTATSDVTGARRESGSRASDTHNVGGNVVVEGAKGSSTREAKRVCLTCNVRGECLEYALAHDERFGIWGGLSERERRKLKKRA